MTMSEEKEKSHVEFLSTKTTINQFPNECTENVNSSFEE